jgi:hypothetical protein
MYAVRLWSVRHARGLNRFYQAFEKVMVALHPLWNKIGYDKLETPFQKLEEASKVSCSTARCAGNARSPRPACPAR